MKKTKKNNSELGMLILTIVAVAILLGTRENPMSNAGLYMVIGLFAVGVMGYGSYAWLERPADERERELLMVASKHAYLVSSLVMAIGIIVQSINHDLDIWLPLALGSALTVKLISFFIHKRDQE